jgi:hypothetical protein
MKILAKNLQWYQRLNMVGRLGRSAPDWTSRRCKSLNWLHLQSLHLSASSPLNYSRSSCQEFVTCSVLISRIYWGHKDVSSKTINFNSISELHSKWFKSKVRKSFRAAQVGETGDNFTTNDGHVLHICQCLGSQIRPGRGTVFALVLPAWLRSNRRHCEIGKPFRFLYYGNNRWKYKSIRAVKCIASCVHFFSKYDTTLTIQPFREQNQTYSLWRASQTLTAFFGI